MESQESHFQNDRHKKHKINLLSCVQYLCFTCKRMIFRHYLIAFQPTNVMFDGSIGLGAAMMLGGVNKQLFLDGRMIALRNIIYLYCV
ncbi:hypothetical protein WN51_11185 [Melipona quadrifasciata]|uniref:Uncharacterized protein n=1 Tax=Melipona quadrifasciata TaxID=166423 RepID=A0A0N0BHU7_9HYME|nr:hypothetical protein WN51_11185 [Melipona quadrifasciata]